ncbi:DUF397 domain-containing protein [Streptomyces zingiberis]|uniref:DUF397 domain-containing protein n=1 Tax=Streptomyces zingiberis TaxID=2053010 RepID=A0ABX1C8K6_9ACTN|nr:DUF397 domain-containing protein [Streptomyces zingiberis]NJQ03274.1 DUF397 domain-containing protein [Streptomyces zingiberis]
MSGPELAWIKSSYSGGDGDDCVEVATSPGSVHVRDSKDTSRPPLSLSSDSWATFVSSRTGDRADDRARG